jgi:hypothetical protein
MRAQRRALEHLSLVRFNLFAQPKAVSQAMAPLRRLLLESEWKVRLEEAEVLAQERLSEVEEQLQRHMNVQLATSEETVKLRARLGELDGDLAQAAARETELSEVGCALSSNMVSHKILLERQRLVR